MSTLIAGLILVMAGEMLRLWGISYAGGETRTRKAGASALVTQGPFAYVRNPLYLGNIIIYTAIGIMANSLTPYLQIVIFIFSCFQYYYIIVDEEEPVLRDLFKEKYEDYAKSVNRFLPGKPYDTSKQSKIKFDRKAGWKSEKRTFQGILTVLFMVVLIYILSHQ
jgi:protein-S-isoprenylcysteine O-methyltransferase Ste14